MSATRTQEIWILSNNGVIMKQKTNDVSVRFQKNQG